MTTEQLAALKEVASRAQEVVPGSIYDIPHPEYAGALHRISDKLDSSWADYGQLATVIPALANHIAAFDPTTCLALLEEVERLRLRVEEQIYSSCASDLQDGPCDHVCTCTHPKHQHIQPGEGEDYGDCAAEDDCPCLKFQEQS